MTSTSARPTSPGAVTAAPFDPAAAAELLERADLLTPMALRTAATLRLVDRIDEGAHSIAELATATGTRARPLGRLVDHLTSLGLLTQGEDGLEVTAVGTLLHSRLDHWGVRPMLDLNHVLGRSELALVDLVHTIRTGAAAFEARGRTLWEDLDAAGPGDDVEPFRRDTPLFDAELISSRFDWGSVDTFVDVGGNTGVVTRTLLADHPHLRATVLDLPCFQAAALEGLAGHGLAERADVACQSFFDPLPPGADVYLLSAILADWEDDDAVRILERCREALPPHGRVVLAEVHLSPDTADPLRRTAALLRLEASMGNPDRTTEDLALLAAQAGLVVDRAEQVSPVRSLLVLRKDRSCA